MDMHEEITKSKEKVEAFAKELLVLCKKYNVTIGACGCCESPWIVDESIIWDSLRVDLDDNTVVVRYNEYRIDIKEGDA